MAFPFKKKPRKKKRDKRGRKKGCTNSPEHRRKQSEAAKNSKYVTKAFNKMMADPERIAKMVATKAKNRAKREAEARKHRHPGLVTIDEMFPLKKKNMNFFWWSSRIKPAYKVKVSLKSVIKFGRPRDPWGFYMNLIRPELIFGAAVQFREDQRFIQEGPHASESIAVQIVEP